LANTIRCEMQWTGPNSTKANNIFYTLTSSYLSTSAELQALIGYWYQMIENLDWRPAGLMPASWSLTQLLVADNSGESENYSYQVTSVPGTVSGNSLPPNCAVAISWPILARYRGGHPRWYLPGVPESNLATPGGNYITSTAAGGYQAEYASFLGAWNQIVVGSTTMQLGTISYYTGHALRDPPLFRAFQDPQVSLRLDSQRRRLGKEPRID
jgi:hypothetical protein